MRETDRVENVVESDGYLDLDGRAAGADRSRARVVVTQKELLETVLARPVTAGQLQRGRQRPRCPHAAAVTGTAAPQHRRFTHTLQQQLVS